MGITVQRHPADKPGDDIVSSVLTTVASQLESGTHAINDGDDRIIYIGSVVDMDFIQPGEMEKLDVKGVEKVGLIAGISGHISLKGGLSMNTQLTIETIK